MRFSFEIGSKVQFDRAFNRLGDHLEDLRPVWDEAEQAFYKIEREQFASEGAKGRSGKWAPLSRAYAVSKAAQYGSQPILRASGKLERSLTGNTGDSVLIKEKDEFSIGTKLFYATYHMEGTDNMPMREPISFSDAQRTDMQKAIQLSLIKIVRGDKSITQSIEVE